MAFKDINWYGLDHKEVNQVVEGGLKYVGTVSHQGVALAIYDVAKPDKKKGHKPVVGIFKQKDYMICGFTKVQANKILKVSAVKCLKCKDVIYSPARHGYITCSCENCFVDGGDEYMRYGWVDKKKTKVGQYNYRTKKFVEVKPQTLTIE